MTSTSLRPADPRSQKVPGLARLYVWSIVLEPLLFFILFPQSVTGIGGNLSRLLQSLVVAGLLVRFALATGSRAGRIRFVRPASPLYACYRTYFVLAIVAGIAGAASGAYLVGESIETGRVSAVSGLINSAAIRPAFEYLIAAYYFVYFTILPQYLLTSRRSIDYFFWAFRTMFIACLVIGTIDLAAALAGIDFVPRALIERIYVGSRFHGIAGEPRDAFVYVFFGLAMLHLQAFYRGEQLKTLWVAVVVTTAVLTQSGSGLVGLMIFVGLYVLYTLPVMGTKRIIQLLVVSSLVAVLVFQVVVRSNRLMLYVEGASGIWSALDSGVTIPGVIAVQVNNIFPIYDLIVKARDFNWLPVLIGSGLGSASAVSNHYMDANAELANPQSQLVRTLYESGIIGAIFFTKAFTRPIKHLTRHLPAKRRNEFLVLMLLLLGCFFGHRSSTAFIYVGMVIAVFRFLDQENATPANGRSPVPAPGGDMVPAA